MAACLGLLSDAVMKHPNKGSLEEKGADSILQLLVHGGEGKAGTSKNWSHFIRKTRVERMNVSKFTCLVCFFVLSSISPFLYSSGHPTHTHAPPSRGPVTHTN